MSKKRQDNPTSPPEKQPAAKPKAKPKRVNPSMPWHVAWRLLVSLLVVLHLVAIVSAPWNLSVGPALPPGYVPPPGQPQIPANDSAIWQRPLVTEELHKFFRHYLNLAYLNHGYEFFAPDPAGTHIIRYRVSTPAGEQIEGEFPNLEQQWPRLFYHRHMMLAEQTEMMGRESGQNYADHLATVHGGPSRMEWLIHFLLDPQRVQEETPLNTPSTYQVIATLQGRPRPESSPAQAESAVAIPGGQQ